MNALFEAAKRGNVKALKKALKDPNIDPNAINERTGHSPLHTAIIWQNKVCTNILVNDKRIDEYLLDKNNRRPIDLATEFFIGLNIEPSKWRVKRSLSP